jgi:hypothetical protein
MLNEILLWLLRIPLLWSILIISVVSVGISVSLLIIIKKTYKYHAALKKNHDVTSFIFNGFGLIYAVLVAFVVFATWTDFEAAKEMVDSEAILSFEIFLDVDVLDEPQRNYIKQKLIEYDSIVANDEWILLESKQTSYNARVKLRHIFSTLSTYNPTNKTQEIVLQEIYGKLNDLVGARRSRIFYATNNVPGIMWTVLIIGALLSISFTYFFSMEELLTQCFLTGAFTLMNALILFLILVLDNSFYGDAKISSDSYEYILNLMQQLVPQQ